MASNPEPIAEVPPSPPSAPIETKASEPEQATEEPTEPAEQDTVENSNASTDATPTTDSSVKPSACEAPREPFPLSHAALDSSIKTPFPTPLDSAKPSPPPTLTPGQQSKYDALLKIASSWEVVPTKSAQEPISDEERMFLTRECLLRYLRATKWNTKEAGKRLLDTLTWRREYGVKEHTPEYIEIENQTGKQVIMGYDINGRPCLYLNPSKQNTEHSPRQIQHLVFMLERTIDLMGPGQETLSLIVNFKETRSGQNATIGQGRETLHILQNHYPERLGRALVINVPFIIWGFFKLITPFIDPLTREKLKFNEDLRDHVPPAQLLKGCGGDVEFEYDHSVYWPALMQLADLRRKELRERWERGGKQIGEHEGYLKGGEEKGIAAITTETELGEKILSQIDTANTTTAEQPPDVSALKVS